MDRIPLRRPLTKRLQNWRDMDSQRLKAKGYFPNQIYGRDREVAIVVKISETGGGGAVNQRCLDAARDAIVAGKIDEAHVILHDGSYVVKEWPLEEVCDLVEEGYEPIQGKWGPYYWLMPDFTISTIEDFKERLDIL